MTPQEVQFNTFDGIRIAGIYTPGSLSSGVVLLHARPETKESWNSYAVYLNSLGLHTLAIDLRGHGESEGKNYETMTDEETKESIYDLEASVEYIKSNVPVTNIGLIGASIGANLAIEYASKHPIKFVQAISPGIEYNGVDAGKAVMYLPESLDIVFISAMDDDRVDGNSTQTETLYNACTSKNKIIKILQSGGHGTQIFTNQPGMIKDLGDWVINLLK